MNHGQFGLKLASAVLHASMLLREWLGLEPHGLIYSGLGTARVGTSMYTAGMECTQGGHEGPSNPVYTVVQGPVRL